MAGEGFKNGTDVVLFAKIGTPAAWVPLACLKTNGWDGTTDQIDTSSKCSGNDKTSIPGDRSWSFKGDGNAVDEVGTPSRASFKTLSDFWSTNKTFPMKMVGVDDPADIVRGDVFITSLSKSAGKNEAVAFSATFQGTGPALFTPESGS